MALLFESGLLDAVVILFGVLVVLYKYMNGSSEYWKARGVPFIPPLLVLGNMKDLVFTTKHLGKVWQEMYDTLEGHKFGGVFRLYLRPALLVRDLDLIKAILVRDFDHFPDRGTKENENNPLGQNLANIEGALWRTLRAKLTPTFTSGKIKMMFHLVKGCATELQDFIKQNAENNEVLKVDEVLAKFTTDVIGTCAFGLECNTMKNPNSEFHEMGRKVMEPSTYRFMYNPLEELFPSLFTLLGLKILPTYVEDFFLRVTKETVDYREKNGVHRNDFMDLLIQIKNKGHVDDDTGADLRSQQTNGVQNQDNFELTDTLIAAQAFIFFLAGFGTSSTTMSFTLYELALNPDSQNRVREELDQVLQAHGGELSYQAVQEMKYLDRVISETMRKHPPVTNLVRKCTKRYTIPGTSTGVEPGITVIIPIYALHHDPKYFPDPSRFDPDRFTEENVKARPRYCYLPFGEGPRICIGARFAMLMTKLGLAALLAKYQFSRCEKTEVPPKIDPRPLILYAKGGIHLKVSNRP